MIFWQDHGSALSWNRQKFYSEKTQSNNRKVRASTIPQKSQYGTSQAKKYMKELPTKKQERLKKQAVDLSLKRSLCNSAMENLLQNPAQLPLNGAELLENPVELS